MAIDPSLHSLLQERRAGLEQALAVFDGLPPVPLDLLWGRWEGREIRTGHPMEGWLEASGWYGKEFLDAEHVHPLLMRLGDGEPFPIRALPGSLALARRLSPRSLTVPLPLLRRALWLLRTEHSQARLRRMEVRGVVSATMLYDHLPVQDTFRQVDGDTVLGLMQEKGVPRPYLFLLERRP
ncbi:DUF4334 domain-containing protein [Synechococcus sp. BSF8S]|uniref:DUF4334 domain-containing protein n=1 Tax=Synechococcales TaxID=1890424 RepID=UPI0016241F65|nr:MULTISPECIES: DUF4334 domain-containing protein [unclassified Synechococcus]MBC1261019.1 DUF4334 domain-containing protein [Synechococcus sp. BSF8S]MBC1263922.1 DUF4334 domain-containing protein [Synechococcus sp. BSA11S]